MYQSSYYLDKSTGTLADNLAAFGLAFVLNGVASGRAAVRLEDRGSAFAVVIEPEMRPEWVERCAFFSGAPFLITIDKKSQLRMVKGTSLSLAEIEGVPKADYADEKQNNTAFFEWLKALPAADKAKAVRGELPAPSAPHPDWDLFRAVNPAALQGYNALLAEWWRGRDAFPELLGILLKMAARVPNDLEGAAKAWGALCKARGWDKPKEATAIQLLNPAQGKGTNNPKAAWRDPGNVKGFWLLEWLKLAGLRHGGLTRLVRGTKDRKTYVLAPVRLDWGQHIAVMGKFQRLMAGSAKAVQLDILASLRYTQALLDHLAEARPSDLAEELFGHSAADVVSGLQMAFYKSLGNAIATMNIASIRLPSWVRPRGPEDLTNLRSALDEHMAVVRGLDEERGDQYDLLILYREFMSGNDLNPYFAFAAAYSAFAMGQMVRRKPVRQFTTTTLEALFMNSDSQDIRYSEIVQSEGFRNVAYAIRRSTVTPQWHKSKQRKPVVDIRYGLGQQLARKAAYKDEFLAELTEFLHLYNSENAQLRESNRDPLRRNVTTADIEAVVALVDRFGSKVVGNMLIAYGYATEPRPKGEPEEAAELGAETSLAPEADDETEDDTDDA